MISSTKGYSLLKSPDVKLCIDKLEAKTAEGMNFKASALIRRIEEVAQANIMDIFHSDNTVKLKNEMDETLQRCIAGFKVKIDYEEELDKNGFPTGKKIPKTVIYDVKMFDKLKAIELLARDQGIFRETKVIQHDLGKNAASILLEAEKRALNMREVNNIPDTFSGDEVFDTEPEKNVEVFLDFTGDSLPAGPPEADE